jgi:ketosteroid isomerase-like protein
MPEELAAPIVAYIQAKQDHDTKSLLKTLSDDAIVTDEGHTYEGLDEIKVWSDKANQDFKAEYEVGKVSLHKTETVVKVKVAGDFPGSPLLLPIHFTLDKGKIRKVLILS